MAEPVLTCSGVSKAYGSRTVLRGVDLSVSQGERVALVGRSGAGKTTLLRVLSGLLQPDSGEVRLGGELVQELSGQCVLLMQEETLLPWRRVWENAAVGTLDPSVALNLLDRLGLAGRLESWPHELSGGERRRVELVRALSRTPDVLLMDEPLSSVDAITRYEIQTQASGLLLPHQAVVFSTHDLAEAVRLGTRVVLMSRRTGNLHDLRVREADGRVLSLTEVVSRISSALDDDAPGKPS